MRRPDTSRPKPERPYRETAARGYTAEDADSLTETGKSHPPAAAPRRVKPCKVAPGVEREGSSTDETPEGFAVRGNDGGVETKRR